MTALLVDLSHHNAIPDWQVLRSSVAGVIGKVSEGTAFADPAFPALRSGAEANGLALGGYHFTHLLDPLAEARWFIRCLGGALRPGEFVGLDLEVAVAGVDPVAWVGRWLDAMGTLGVPVRLLYLNRSELAAYNWAPIAKRVLLWLAAYDGNTTPVSSGAWPTLTLKQFTDRGTVPGEAGTVDIDVLFGTLTDLTGGPMPQNAPLTDADVQKIWWAPTKDPETGQNIQIIGLLKEAEANAAHAARDAAAALTLAQATAKAVAALAARPAPSAADIAAALAAGYKLTVVPASPAP